MQQAIKPHVAKYKERIVEEFVRLMNEYPIIGILNVENLPAPQFQKMRASLREKVIIKMAKRRLIKITIENVKDKKRGIEQLEKYLVGMPAMIFTKDNPFNLSKVLKKSKSKAPAKAGQTAPFDIVVQAGPTPFTPGPIIGELSSIGIKSGVEGGKVSITRETTVVREGERVSATVAGILSRLGVTPMEVGLDLVAVYENGIIFTKDVLAIDEEQYINNLRVAANSAISLSAFIGYITKDNVEILIRRAFNEAEALAVSEEIISDKAPKEKERTEIEEKPEKETEEEKKIEIEGEKIKIEEEIIREEVKEEKQKEEKAEEEIEEKGIEKPKPEIKEEKVEEELQLLKDIKAGGVEVKERITEESMKKAEELLKEIQKRAIEEKEAQEKKRTDVDDKVREMVEKTKGFAAGIRQPTSEDILEEIEEESPKPEKKEETKLPSLQELAEQAKKRERKKKEKVVPSAHELAKKKREK